MLLLAPGVVGDDRVGRVEDHLRAAVVLVEHDRGDVLEHLLELGDVAHVGAAPPIDRLVPVADDGDLAVVGGEEQGDLVLRHVRVLVLVDQDVLEPALVLLQDLGVLAEQLDDLHQQVVEVHRPGRLQARLVLDVDLAVLALERVGGLGHRLLRADQLVLPQADPVVNASWREPLRVEAQVTDDVAGEALGVGGVVDAEVARVAERLGLGPQDAHAGGVERAHPHRLDDRPDQRLDAVAHLLGGLVGERDRQDRRRRRAVVDEVGDAVGEHPGLARAGAGDHQQRAAAVHDGVELIGVECVEFERVRHVPASVRTGCRAGAATTSRRHVSVPERRYRGAP